MTGKIVQYLRDTYHPRALLLYGSYVRGDFDACSDFDCMVIVNEKTKKHDSSVIEGVPLDCYIFTADETVSEDPDVFLPACDAEIVVDDGVGRALKERVRRYVREHEKIDDGEKQFIVSWIKKTLKRMEKDDDEGNCRAVMLLNESLADYYLLRDMFYFGSKQAIGYLRENDPKGFALFHDAIRSRTADSIAAWANHVIGESKNTADR